MKSDKPIYIYVTPFFASPGCWSGTYGYDFVKALMADGRYDVRVFMEGERDYDFGGIHVYCFPVKRLPSNLFPFFFERHNQRSFLRKVKEMLLAESNNPTIQQSNSLLSSVSICHANTANFASYALALKKLNPNCLTLLHHHCLSSFGLNMGALRHCWLYNMILFPAFRRRHEQIDCHVFISEAVRRSFLAAPNTDWTSFADYKRQMRALPYRPVRIKNSIILHNGVNATIFNPVLQSNNQTIKQSNNSSTFTIGCIGHFSELKNQLSLIRAVEKLSLAHPELKFAVRFVGSGDLRESCKKYIADHFKGFGGFEPYEAYVRKTRFVEFTGDVRCSCGNVSFEFICEVRHEQLPEYYRSLDLFVLPSYFEGFGCVYLEAWACCVPFIACEGQGSDDLIRACDREKWLCKQNDVDDLARKIDAYRVNRWTQTLACEGRIDRLVGEFLMSFEKVR